MDCVLGTDGQVPDKDGIGRCRAVKNGESSERGFCIPTDTTSHRPRRDGTAVLLRNDNVGQPDSIHGITNLLISGYLPNDGSGTLVAVQNDTGWRSWSNHEWGVGEE